jgi:hypothetical protein
MKGSRDPLSAGADLAAFGVAFLLVGIPYWLTPYGQLDLPGALLGIPAIVVVVVALLLAIRVGGVRRTMAVVGAAMPAVVALRVAFDVARDPTSHNLWPFELVIAVLVGGACALAGALAGGLLRRLRS